MAGRAIEFPVEGLSDGVVTLRLPADADVPALTEMCRDEAIQRYTTVPNPYGPGDARNFVRMAADGVASGEVVYCVTTDAASGEPLGNCGIRQHPTDPARWDVGYLVAPWARGRGVATRAVRLLCRFGFDELGAERIELCAEPANLASLGVARRAGFRREGVLRRYMEIKGVRRDIVMHSLLRGELDA